MDHLAMHFGISNSSIHRYIHKILPYLHAYVVPKYIRWHTMNKWRMIAGTLPEFPSVVGIADCTPHRISKPLGNLLNINFEIIYSNFKLLWKKFEYVCNMLIFY